MSSLYHFDTPLARSATFDAAFKDVLLENAADALKIANTHREKMVQVMKHIVDIKTNCPADLMKAINEYLPYILAIVSQGLAASKVPNKRALLFSWTSALVQTDPKKKDEILMYNYSGFEEELVSVYTLYGLAHYQMAEETLNLQSDEKANTPASPTQGDSKKDAVQLLKTAAGIFQWLGTELAYHMNLPIQQRPPDIWRGVHLFMSQLCLANAQELAVQTGIAKGTGFTTLAKLCVGAADKYKSASATLFKEAGQDNVPFVRADLRDYVMVKAHYYQALARLFLGRAAEADTKWGLAVAYMHSAVKIIEDIRMLATTNIGYEKFQKQLGGALAEMRREHKRLHDDNAKVYFELLPTEIPIPQGHFIITEIPYQPPSPIETQFFAVDPEKLKGCIIS